MISFNIVRYKYGVFLFFLKIGIKGFFLSFYRLNFSGYDIEVEKLLINSFLVYLIIYKILYILVIIKVLVFVEFKVFFFNNCSSSFV